MKVVMLIVSIILTIVNAIVYFMAGRELATSQDAITGFELFKIIARVAIVNIIMMLSWGLFFYLK